MMNVSKVEFVRTQVTVDDSSVEEFTYNDVDMITYDLAGTVSAVKALREYESMDEFEKLQERFKRHNVDFTYRLEGDLVTVEVV